MYGQEQRGKLPRREAKWDAEPPWKEVDRDASRAHFERSMTRHVDTHSNKVHRCQFDMEDQKPGLSNLTTANVAAVEEAMRPAPSTLKELAKVIASTEVGPEVAAAFLAFVMLIKHARLFLSMNLLVSPFECEKWGAANEGKDERKELSYKTWSVSVQSKLKSGIERMLSNARHEHRELRSLCLKNDLSEREVRRLMFYALLREKPAKILPNYEEDYGAGSGPDMSWNEAILGHP